MLAVRDTHGASLAAPGLDAGAVATAVARSWAHTGRDVLLVDADAHGTGLSGRIGAAARLALQPAQRGLPSLIASRASLSADTVVRHCWLLPTEGGGSVHLLGAPAHPDGARRTAGWLADRCGELAALADRWAVIVSMPGPTAPSYEPLMQAASQRLTLAVAPGTAPAGGLRAVGAAFWLRFAPDPETRLLTAEVEGTGPHSLSANTPTLGTSAPLIGGIRRVRPAALLGARPRQRDRVLLEALAGVAGRLGAAADRVEEPAGRCVAADTAAGGGRTPDRSPSEAGS